jgi:nucleoside-diphosphate-sugar epimerase
MEITGTKQNILITGGFGTIGTPLVDKLIDIGCYIYIIDNLSKQESLESYTNMNFRAKASYTDISYSSYIWADIKFSHIIHLAAYTNEETVDMDYIKAYTDNLLGTVRMINKCIDKNINFIYLHYPETTGYLGLIKNQILQVIEYYSKHKNLQCSIINCDSNQSLEDIHSNIIQSVLN